MATTTSLCNECESAAGLICSGCRTTRYCSKACQQLSRPTHKHLCKTFKDFQDRPTSKKPNESYSRAILFRPEEKHSRFIWLKLILHDYRYLGPYLTPDEKASDDALALSKDEESSFDRSFSRNDILNRELNYTIKLGSRGHGEEELEECLSNDAQANDNLLSILEQPVSPFVYYFSDPIMASSLTERTRSSGKLRMHHAVSTLLLRISVISPTTITLLVEEGTSPWRKA
jgi:hypothetical protein